MRFAFLSVIAFGAAIGFLMPRGPVPAAAPAAPAPAADRPRETVLTREGNGHFYAVVDINDEPIRFVVDTGASMIALTQEDARRAHVAFDPAQFHVIGRGASGDVMGQEVTIYAVDLEGKRASGLRGVVLASSGVSLLGQSYLARMGSVEIKGDAMRLRP